MFLSNVCKVVRRKGIPYVNIVRFGVVDGFLCGSEITDELYVDGMCFIARKYVKSLKFDCSSIKMMRAFFGSLGDDFSNDLMGCKREFGVIDNLYDYLIDRGAIVGIHLERESAYSFYAGIVVGCSSKWIEMKGIDPLGNFYDGLIDIKKSRVTKVEYQTRYLRALGLVASGYAESPSQAKNIGG